MTTETLALIIGGYAVFAGLGLLLDTAKAVTLLDRLRADPLATYIAGLLAFFIGSFILAVHWKFDDVLATIVTLMGLVATIEGAILLVWPRLLVGLPSALTTPRASRLWGGAAAAIGIALVIAAAPI